MITAWRLLLFSPSSLKIIHEDNNWVDDFDAENYDGGFNDDDDDKIDDNDDKMIRLIPARTAATRRTSLSLRTGPHQGNRCHRHRPSRLMIINIIMLVMEMLIIITIIMTWQSLPPSLSFQVDGLLMNII